MSWDAVMVKLPVGKSIAEITEKYGNDWGQTAVGTISEVFKAFESHLPEASNKLGSSDYFTDEFYVQFQYEESFETGLVEAIIVTSDGHEDTMPILQYLCDVLEVKLVDMSSSEIVDFESILNKSMGRFRKYRDKFREERLNEE